MFGSSESDDLFSPQSGASSKAGTTPIQGTAPVAGSTTHAKGAMSPQKRLRRFNELYQFVGDRIGLQPVLKKFPEQVRDTVWQQMFQLATSKEQMEAVVELFPKWRDSKRRFTPAMSEAFVRTSRTPLSIWDMTVLTRPRAQAAARSCTAHSSRCRCSATTRSTAWTLPHRARGTSCTRCTSSTR